MTLLPADTPSRRCPSGCGPLQAFVFRGTSLDRCPSCAGIWFDGGEYERLGRLPEDAFHTLEGLAVSSVPAVDVPASARQCPSCAEHLSPRHVGRAHVRVTLDQCAGCGGLWAEDRELETLSEALCAGKPSFETRTPDVVRQEVAWAVAEEMTPRAAHHAHLFQSLAAWLRGSKR